MATGEEEGGVGPGVHANAGHPGDDESDDHFHLVDGNVHAASSSRGGSRLTPLYLPPPAPMPPFIQAEITRHALQVRARAALKSQHFILLYSIFTLCLV